LIDNPKIVKRSVADDPNASDYEDFCENVVFTLYLILAVKGPKKREIL